MLSIIAEPGGILALQCTDGLMKNVKTRIKCVSSADASADVVVICLLEADSWFEGEEKHYRNRVKYQDSAKNARKAPAKYHVDHRNCLDIIFP